MKFGIVNRSESALFPYQAWPTVCRDENGTLYVTCSGHRLGHLCPFGKNLMFISRDEGESWSSPIIINDTELDDRDSGILSLGGGKLLMTYFNHYKEFYFGERNWIERNTNDVTHDMSLGLLEGWKNLTDEQNHAGSFIRISHDGGFTWDKPVKAPVTAPHGPIKLKNGKLLYLGKEFHTDGEYEEGAIYAFESEDDGLTWNCLSKIPDPYGFAKNLLHEPYALELPDGRLVGMIRAHGDAIKEFHCGTLRCFSDGGGRTWTVPEEFGVCGFPPHLLLHSSGAVILTYGRRTVPFGQRVRISYDGCLTFSEEIVISEEASDDDLGYPSTVELSDGSLLTVYYQKYKNDKFCSILSTKWEIPKA
ncbi:MAG: exo-alpha-sialidase [Clostridia bacterium]|nr:exo-alpha-sialidase [Clostridia bacterium]